MEPVRIDNINIGHYYLEYEEIKQLKKHGFTPTNSLNISAYMFFENDVIFRLHNGSMYLFEGIADWGKKTLSSSLRRDVIGYLIRKKIPYRFVGILSMEDRVELTDLELLYFYMNDEQKDITRKIDTYKSEYLIEEMTFYGPNDNSIENYRFQLACISDGLFYSLGQIYIEKIIDADWAKWNKLKIHLYSYTYTAINFMRRRFGEKVQIIFTHPEKVNKSNV